MKRPLSNFLAGAFVLLVASSAAAFDKTTLQDCSTGTLLEASDYSVWGERSDKAVGGSLPEGLTLRDHFSGKEDQGVEFGLPYLNFGARFYAPGLKRWLTVDPLSEEYYGVSPYAYCANNPVNLADPDGNSWLFNAKTGEFITHLDDKDDYIYLVPPEQSESSQDASDHSMYKTDENQLWEIALNEKVDENVALNIMTYFFDYANRTSENGDKPYVKERISILVDVKYIGTRRADSKGNEIKAYLKQMSCFGYDTISIFAHEIKHVIDRREGQLPPQCPEEKKTILKKSPTNLQKNTGLIKKISSLQYDYYKQHASENHYDWDEL